MQRLSGTDAGFLYGETPAWHMHAGVVVLLDPATASAGFGVEALRNVIRRRLPELGLFRYRVEALPFGIGGAHWVEAPDIDVDDHIRPVSLPAPAGERELTAFAADVFSRKLDRRRPLWEMWVVEQLDDGRAALIIKVHHACVDGVRGVQLYDVLFDPTPDAPAGRVPGTDAPSHGAPSRGALLRAAATGVVAAPARTVRALRAVAGAGVRAGRLVHSGDHHNVTVPFTAPNTRFNGSLTPKRSIALCSVPIDEVRALRKANAATFNDVVLAMCTGALRQSLVDHGVTPTKPLIAQIPVGVHRNTAPAASTEIPGNFVSAMAATLPVDLADPLQQLEVIGASTHAAKALHRVLGEDFLLDVVSAAPPALISTVVRVYTGLHLDRLHPPIFNVLVSNVPGPPFHVYAAGAKVIGTYPLGPLLAGCGLNVTVFSYVDHLDIGLIACPDIVDDVDAVAAALPSALHALSSATRRAG